jgi:DNA-binding response OmpR family regulator
MADSRCSWRCNSRRTCRCWTLGCQVGGDNHLVRSILLDAVQPGIDGLQVCQRLCDEADRHVPVLMLTARDTLADKGSGFAAGADDYVFKPFASDELLWRCRGPRAEASWAAARCEALLTPGSRMRRALAGRAARRGDETIGLCKARSRNNAARPAKARPAG